MPRVPSTYIAGHDDRAVPLPYATYLARTRLGVEPVILDTDHSAFLSAPTVLADLLLGLTRH